MLLEHDELAKKMHLKFTNKMHEIEFQMKREDATKDFAERWEMISLSNLATTEEIKPFLFATDIINANLMNASGQLFVQCEIE